MTIDPSAHEIDPNLARAHFFGMLTSARRIEEILSAFGGLEHKDRGQEDRRLDGAFRQLRIAPVVQHQRFGMNPLIADVRLGRKRPRHDLDLAAWMIDRIIGSCGSAPHRTRQRLR